MAFARKLVELNEDLKRSCTFRPVLPHPVPAAQQTFSEMQYGQEAELWQFVELRQVFTYLRGGKSLRIPEEWKGLVPKAFPALS